MTRLAERVLFVIWLAVLVSSEMEDISGEGNSSLAAVFQEVLNDPEFLAFNSEQQLHIITFMYNLLQNQLKGEEHFEIKKRDLSSQNVFQKKLKDAYKKRF